MPVLHKYKNKRGYYIKARPPDIGNITYKIKNEGYSLVDSLPLLPGDDVSWDTIAVFKVLGLIYTDKSGVLDPDDGFEPDPEEAEELALSETEARDLLEKIEDSRDLTSKQRDEITSILGIEPKAPEDIPPNELADLYEALFTVLENLPDGTHPGWEFAITSVIFGGDGLAPGNLSYGGQQATRNRFDISDYRAQYGDGEHVTEFPAISTDTPNRRDRTFADTDLRLPVAPESNEVLPLYVDDRTFRESITLLAEFPAEPEAEVEGSGREGLLNPKRFPGITSPSRDPESEEESGDSEETRDTSDELSPNELAELYDAFFNVLKALPESTAQAWRAAIETIAHGSEYLQTDAQSYGAQQRDRNGFGMPEYREQHGDGERVTEFQAITVGSPLERDSKFLDADFRIPVSPDSEEVLPLDVSEDEVSDALALLEEFPAEPEAEETETGVGTLLDVERLLADFEVEDLADDIGHSEHKSDAETGQAEPGTSTKTEHFLKDIDASREERYDQTSEKILRQEGVGQVNDSITEAGDSHGGTERKYDDPRAERAHRRAQQRDPSDVVKLGEEITLVLQEVDYAGHPPTIMGRKNKLVIFVVDAPQDLSKHDTIQAKVIDYGGNNNSAEAAFIGYGD